MDWNLADFNAGTPVTVTAADAGAGTGNAGQGEYRITCRVRDSRSMTTT